MAKRQTKFIEGDIIRIPINENEHTYARIIIDRAVVVYDCKSQKEVDDLPFIASRPILFIVYVYLFDLKEDRWHKIGNLPLGADLKKRPPCFVKDIVPKGSPATYRIYENEVYRKATLEQCEGLEPMWVLEAAHVEERLNDVYYGDPDKMIKEYLRGN